MVISHEVVSEAVQQLIQERVAGLFPLKMFDLSPGEYVVIELNFRVDTSDTIRRKMTVEEELRFDE